MPKMRENETTSLSFVHSFHGLSFSFLCLSLVMSGESIRFNYNYITNSLLCLPFALFSPAFFLWAEGDISKSEFQNLLSQRTKEVSLSFSRWSVVSDTFFSLNCFSPIESCKTTSHREDHSDWFPCPSWEWQWGKASDSSHSQISFQSNFMFRFEICKECLRFRGDTKETDKKEKDVRRDDVKSWWVLSSLNDRVLILPWFCVLLHLFSSMNLSREECRLCHYPSCVQLCLHHHLPSFVFLEFSHSILDGNLSHTNLFLILWRLRHIESWIRNEKRSVLRPLVMQTLDSRWDQEISW